MNTFDQIIPRNPITKNIKGRDKTLNINIKT